MVHDWPKPSAIALPVATMPASIHDGFPSAPLTPPEGLETSEPPSSSPFDNKEAFATINTATHVMSTERMALAHLEHLYKNDSLVQENIVRAVDQIVRSVREGGKLVLCGVGKSGKIARKIEATMNSLGILSVFLHPTEALHGDLGIVQGNDTLMVISFSGRTQELKLVLPHIPPTVPVIAITSHLHPSILSYNTSDIAIGLPAPVHEDEESSFGVNAPTSSTTVALCLGDALALCTARRLHTSPTRGPAEVFKSFHPGGAIGASTAAAAAAAAGTATATTPMSMESSLSFSSPGEYLQGQQEQQQGQQDLLASHLLPLEKIPVVSPSGADSEVRLLDAVLVAVQSPEAKSWVSLPSSSSSSPPSLALISPRNLRALSASMDVGTTVAEIATAGLPVTIPEEAFLPVPVSTPVDEVRRLVNERKLFGVSAPATIVAGVDGEVCMGVVDGEDL